MIFGMHIESLQTTVARSSVQGRESLDVQLPYNNLREPPAIAQGPVSYQPNSPRVVISHSHGQGEITGEALFKHHSPVDDWTERLTVIASPPWTPPNGACIAEWNEQGRAI
jgi:hypothetical protein